MIRIIQGDWHVVGIQRDGGFFGAVGFYQQGYLKGIQLYPAGRAFNIEDKVALVL